MHLPAYVPSSACKDERLYSLFNRLGQWTRSMFFLMFIWHPFRIIVNTTNKWQTRSRLLTRYRICYKTKELCWAKVVGRWLKVNDKTARKEIFAKLFIGD